MTADVIEIEALDILYVAAAKRSQAARGVLPMVLVFRHFEMEPPADVQTQIRNWLEMLCLKDP